MTASTRWIPAAAVGTAAVLACAGAVWGYHVGRSGAVRIDLPKADVATTAECANLIAQLPSDLEGRHRRGVVGSDPNVKQRAAAWGAPPLILRCGVAEPPAITVGGPDYDPLNNHYEIIGADKALVGWLLVVHDDTLVATTTDRAAYIEIQVPSADETILVDFASAIVHAIPNKAGQFIEDQPKQ